MNPAVQKLTRYLKGDIARSFNDIYNLLTRDWGCRTEVFTIYVSFFRGDQMVAAIYPRTNAFEIALALPEDHRSPALYDASHLTWRTMPVATEVRDRASGDIAATLATEAASRVAEGLHDVNRPPEYFASRSSRGRPYRASPANS